MGTMVQSSVCVQNQIVQTCLHQVMLYMTWVFGNLGIDVCKVFHSSSCFPQTLGNLMLSGWSVLASHGALLQVLDSVGVHHLVLDNRSAYNAALHLQAVAIMLKRNC